MKDSGIKWIGCIPDDWNLVPNKYLFSHHSTKVGKDWKNYQLLSLTTAGVKLKDINATGGKVPDNYENYQTVEPGDMVFCLFDLDVSAVFSGLSNLQGMITSAYEVVKPNKKTLDQHFSEYYFRYVFSNRYYKMYSKNIRYTITSEQFSSIKTIIPPLQTQKVIGTFLEKRISDVNRLIEVEKHQIKILLEYKSSMIKDVVISGVANKGDLKDSGVEWFGFIPKVWQVVSTKTLFNIIAGATPDSADVENWDGDIRWITPADFKTDDIYVSGGRRNISNKGYNSCSTELIPKNSIIFSKRAPIGSVAINNEILCTNQGCLSCVPKESINVKYFYYQMSAFSDQYELFGSGTTFKEISAQKFGSFKLVLPPIDIQDQIVDYLDEKCNNINNLINLKNTKIKKLEEYCGSIIFEYVTGKKEATA